LWPHNFDDDASDAADRVPGRLVVYMHSAEAKRLDSRLYITFGCAERYWPAFDDNLTRTVPAGTDTWELLAAYGKMSRQRIRGCTAYDAAMVIFSSSTCLVMRFSETT
jgi:hypothetical protein